MTRNAWLAVGLVVVVLSVAALWVLADAEEELVAGDAGEPLPQASNITAETPIALDQLPSGYETAAGPIVGPGSNPALELSPFVTGATDGAA